MPHPAAVASPTETAEAPAPAEGTAAVAAQHRDTEEEALVGIEDAPEEGHATALARVGDEGRMTRIAESQRRGRNRSRVPCTWLHLGLHAHGRRGVDGAVTEAPTRFVCNWWAGAGWRIVDCTCMQSCIRSYGPGEGSTERGVVPPRSVDSLAYLAGRKPSWPPDDAGNFRLISTRKRARKSVAERVNQSRLHGKLTRGLWVHVT